MDFKLMVVAFSAKKGGGKTTISNELVKLLSENNEVEKIAFADPIYRHCLILNWYVIFYEYIKDNMDQSRLEDIASYFKYDEISESIINWMKSHKHIQISDNVTLRKWLQLYGTNVWRFAKPNIWIDLHRSKLDKELNSEKLIIVDDLRFVNELEYINEYNGKTIRLLRGDTTDNHISENNLDNNSNWDYVCDNKNQSVEETTNEIYNWLKSVFPNLK
jgi:hypothetical protein